MAYNSGPLHRASLVPVSSHSPQLLELIHSPITAEMVAYVSEKFSKVVSNSDGDECSRANSKPSQLPIPPQSPVKVADKQLTKDQSDITTYMNAASLEDFLRTSLYRRQVKHTEDVYVLSKDIPLDKFIAHVVTGSYTGVPALVAAVIYAEKLKRRLPKNAYGHLPTTAHRIFLAALIVATKFLNDNINRNRIWAQCAQIFTLADINFMEYQILYVLDYDLRFTEEEMMRCFEPFLPKSGVGAAQPHPVISAQASRENVEEVFTKSYMTPKSKKLHVMLPSPSPSPWENIHTYRKSPFISSPSSDSSDDSDSESDGAQQQEEPFYKRQGKTYNVISPDLAPPSHQRTGSVGRLYKMLWNSVGLGGHDHMKAENKRPAKQHAMPPHSRIVMRQMGRREL